MADNQELNRRRIMSTTEEKMKEIQRELNMRKRVFPTWVLQGRITQQVADKRIKIMEDIFEDYKIKKEQEDKQMSLL